MDVLTFYVDWILHLDQHLAQMVVSYQQWTYGVLLLIIFVETGLVIMPFLPGDSLLFTAGALAGLGLLHMPSLILLLALAAIAGDTVNYALGSRLGDRVQQGKIPLIKVSHLERTQGFFARHGGKSIVLARFVPIVRTFAPFVAGMGRMQYGRFLLFNVAGGLSWVVLLLSAGYFFGTTRIVRENFELVVPAIILLSLLPMFIEMARSRLLSRPGSGAGI